MARPTGVEHGVNAGSFFPSCGGSDERGLHHWEKSLQPQ